MVNFHNPALVAREFAAYINFVHCLDGIFIWEFFMMLEFDWKYFTGRREFKWTYVLYFLSRFGALAQIICKLILFNVSRQINCQALMVGTLIPGYMAFVCALMLVALRVISIWNPNHLVAAVAIGICLTNMGFLIYGIKTVRATWSATEASCVFENTFQSRDNITVTMASDSALLIIMLVGLLRSRPPNYDTLRHLYAQGLIWLTAATMAEVPAVVLINFNLNDPWNMMFQDFAFFTMVICATRMYRAQISRDTEVETHSHSTTVLSQLRFRETTPRRTTVTAGGNSALSKSHFKTSYPSTEDVELNLTGKTAAAAGDEEAQSYKMPSLPSQDGQ